MDTLQKKMISIAKSVLIFALAALTVYQVNQLWFVNITDRNFFLYVQARFAPGSPDVNDAFVLPYRIVYGAGDGRFTVRHSRIRETDAWVYGAPAISALLANGDFISREPINSDYILHRQVFLLEYAFPMCAEIFAQALGQRTGAALTGHGLDHFYRVALLPPMDESSPLHAFFMDNEYAWEFILASNHVNSIVISSAESSHLHFIPIQSQRIGFIPVQPSQFSYNPIAVINPYQDAFGSLHLSTIRRQIEPFFNNPATINQRPMAGGIYTFSNLNTMVRYLSRSVIEYTSFRPIGSSATSDPMSDFSAAFEFVRQDPHVINEKFLAGYESRGREHVFWFDYIIDDFPLVFAEPWLTGPNCQNPLPHPIEVVVDRGRVVHYRRLAYNFHVIENLTYTFGTDVLTEHLAESGVSYTLGFTILREPILDLEVIGR